MLFYLKRISACLFHRFVLQKLIFMPYAVLNTAVLIVANASSMSLVVFPEPFVLFTILFVADSVAIALIKGPLSHVAVRIRDELALPVDFIVFPLPSKSVAIGPFVPAVAVFFVFVPVAFVDVAVVPLKSAMSLPEVLFPLTVIDVSVDPFL